MFGCYDYDFETQVRKLSRGDVMTNVSYKLRVSLVSISLFAFGLDSLSDSYSLKHLPRVYSVSLGSQLFSVINLRLVDQAIITFH